MQAVQDYYLLKVKKTGSFDCLSVKKSLALSAEEDTAAFDDDGTIVVVTELDLDGYDARCDSDIARNERQPESSLACRVQFASQAAIARLSCLWVRCHADPKSSIKKLGNSMGADQLGSLGVDIRVY